MPDETQAIEGAENPTQETPEISTEADLIAHLTRKPTEAAEEESTETDVTEPGDELDDDTGTEEEPDGIDLEALTDEQLQALATKTRSKAISEFGKLRADKRNLEAKLAEIQAKSNPLEKPGKPAAAEIPERIAKLATTKEVQTEFENTKNLIDALESILEDNEDHAQTDVIHSANGKDFTKKDIKLALKNARLTKDEILPARFKEIEEIATRAEAKSQYDAKAKAELPWLANDNSEVRQRFQAMAESPLMEEIRKKVPAVSHEIDFLLAHAANSMFGGTKKQTVIPTPGITPRPKAPAAPGGAGSPAPRPDALRAKAIEAAQKAYEDSGGSVEAFVALQKAKGR